MTNQSNYRFEPGIWVKFFVNDKMCIGRTVVNTKGEKMISMVNENGTSKRIPFELAESLRKIVFASDDMTKLAKQVAINNNQVKPSLHKNPNIMFGMGQIVTTKN